MLTADLEFHWNVSSTGETFRAHCGIPVPNTGPGKKEALTHMCEWPSLRRDII